MSLQDEIAKGASQISTDGYAMSIGELMNLYRDEELDLHPEFQRFYRWTPPQKSRLIESILLGIPLPSIFVFQREDGVWDVVDGLQRLGTIFEFAGVLRDEEQKVLPPLTLLKTRYLPSLEGKVWMDERKPSRALTNTQRLLIKRAKLDIKIIKSDSSETSKYELFQRLNTGGTHASDQEVRNCLLIMNNRDMFKWFEALSQNPDFRTCAALTDRQLEERYDLELVLRFTVLEGLQENQLKFEDMGEFLTEEMLKLAQNQRFDYVTGEKSFAKTFRALVECGLEDDAFRKFNLQHRRFMGSFALSAFETIAVGLGHRFTRSPDSEIPRDLVDRVKGIWSNREFTSNSGSGIRANLRIPHIVPLGRVIFGS